MNKIAKCEVCGNPCNPHTSTALEIKEDGIIIEHPTIYNEPTYFLGDKFFCSPEHCLEWYQKENEK